MNVSGKGESNELDTTGRQRGKERGRKMREREEKKG